MTLDEVLAMVGRAKEAKKAKEAALIAKAQSAHGSAPVESGPAVKSANA